MINVNLDLKIITSDLPLKEIYKYCVTKWCDDLEYNKYPFPFDISNKGWCLIKYKPTNEFEKIIRITSIEDMLEEENR